MKPVKLFILRGCPYCRAALQWMDEWMKLNPEYRRIPLDVIDEAEQYEVAKAHDYFLVPTWYVGERKVHEGAASRDIVHRVLEEALSG